MNGVPQTDKELIERLEHAGKTLIALKDTGYRPGLAQRRHDVVQSVWDAFDWIRSPHLRIPTPSKEDIRLMDEAYEWVLLIPAHRIATRRVVHARSLVHPLSDRYLFSWRKIAIVMSRHHQEVQRLHAHGIKIILEGLSESSMVAYEKASGAEMRL